jgi:hypothetical protein
MVTEVDTELTRSKTKDAEGQLLGHGNYYEQNGLRIEGDGEDHQNEPPVRKV